MELGPEQKQIQIAVRDISRKEILPRAAALDKDYAFPRHGLKLLADSGIMGMMLPPNFGGGGADTVSFVAAVEEIARACANTALVFVTHAAACTGILVAGQPAVKEQYLPLMARGDKLGAFAATEPGCGANVFAAASSAKRQGEHYLLNGSKVFVTSGGEADVYLVALRTSNSPGPAGLSMIMVDKGTPGLTFGRKDVRLGMNGVSSSELFFDSCLAPAVNLLGQEGGYMGVGIPIAGLALIGAGALAVGLAQASLEASMEYVKGRVIAGQPLAAYQGLQFMISEMASTVEAARALVYEAARTRDRKDSSLFVAALKAKLFATEMAIDVTNKALQLHGGQGYTRELPIERYFRDARGLSLHFTPSEMLKDTLGKMLLGMMP